MSGSRRFSRARAEHRAPGRRRRVQLYGFTVASDFGFRAGLAQGAAEPDLTFTCGPEAPFPADWLLPPSSPDGSGASFAYLARAPAHDVLRFPGLADFYVAEDHIFCHAAAAARSDLIEIQLLGPVLAFWLERRSIPALHASAVVVAKRAVAFLSSGRGGKTALAAALVKAGHALLTDDILPVEERGDAFFGRPGLAQMRMWPDEATHFLGAYEDLEIVHPDHSKRRVPVGSGGLGRFFGAPLPLGLLYLPERRPRGDGRGIEIAPVSPRDAVIELVRHSFAAQLVQARRWRARRFDLFSRLARRVPVRRLFYPSGFDRLPAVGRRVVEDASQAAGPGVP